MTTLLELVTKYSHAHGASGYEESVRALVRREFNKYVDELQITPLGSVIGIKRAKPAARKNTRARLAAQETPRLLIEAHMDEIGLLVTSIQDGFIRFDEIGHVDQRVLPSQNVLVHGRKTLPGVIGARPPHVLSAQERNKSIPLHDLFIDVGMSDERVRELVHVGDFITFDRAVIPLQNNFVAGKAFDDRAALAALVEMLRQLERVNHAWDVYAVANVNEEDSSVYVGAATSTYAIRPQLALCLDVTHAQQVGLSDDVAPRAGEGVCIARGANVHPVVFTKLVAAATRANLPHQITVYGDDTQTNGWLMQVTGEGVPTALVEIPLRYMHTSVETIHLADVTHTAELLCALVTSLTPEDANALQGETFTHTNISKHSRRPKIRDRQYYSKRNKGPFKVKQKGISKRNVK